MHRLIDRIAERPCIMYVNNSIDIYQDFLIKEQGMDYTTSQS